MHDLAARSTSTTRHEYSAALLAVTCVSLALATLTVACAHAYAVPIDTPAHARLDVSPFHYVLVAGFLGADATDVDTNGETVRLLRSQLGSKTSLNVIEASILPLAQIAAEQASTIAVAESSTDGSPHAERKSLTSKKDLEELQGVFGNVVFWKRLGEEYPDALIITGTLLFTIRRHGGSLKPTFIFIDGRTGTVIRSETFPEENVSDGRQYVPALSLYFRLMDGVIPAFLGALSDQRLRGTRTLLR